MPMDREEQDVMVLDAEGHTMDYPYCGDLGCWCHTDVGYHDEVIHPMYLDEAVEQAYRFYELERERRF